MDYLYKQTKKVIKIIINIFLNYHSQRQTQYRLIVAYEMYLKNKYIITKWNLAFGDITFLTYVCQRKRREKSYLTLKNNTKME